MAQMALHYGYEAVAGPDRLSARDFQYWYHVLAVTQEMQSEEGLKRVRQRVAARKAVALETEVAARTQALQDRQHHHQRRRTRQHQPDWRDPAAQIDPAAPARAVADGTQLTPDVWTNPARLLALLSPDDPRARYLQAGGRLTANGDPVGEDLTVREPAKPPPAPGTPATATATPTVIPTPASTPTATPVHTPASRHAGDLPPAAAAPVSSDPPHTSSLRRAASALDDLGDLTR